RWRRRTSWPLTFDPKRTCVLDLLIFETGRGMITGAGEPSMNVPLDDGTRCGPERLIRVGVYRRARAKYKTRRYTWTPPRFSSLFWSSFCCLVAAGTAADAGTKKKLIAIYRRRKDIPSRLKICS